MSSTLIEKGTIITMDDQLNIYDNGYLYLVGSTIASIGEGETPAYIKEQASQIIDASGKYILPGLTNAHTHLFQSFIRGLADDRPLLSWLQSAIFPVAEHMRAQDAYFAAKLGLIENIRGGATSVIDHQYIHSESDIDDAVLQAALEMKIRFKHAYGWADMNYHPSLQLTKEYVERELSRLYQTYQGSGEGRISIEFAPVIPWGCSDEAMLHLYNLTHAMDMGTHIHVAETEEEVSMNMTQRNLRHVSWLAQLGMLNEKTQLVHSVWLDDEEMDLIKTSGACVVHCPVSNMYLASGAARVSEMVKSGIPVALATDGPGSNNCQDMMEVLKTTALLAKLSSMDAMAILPKEVLQCACNSGAIAMGLPQEIGSLEVGKKGDLVICDLFSPFSHPIHSPLSSLVYSARASFVDTVIINGEVVMKDKEITVVDEEEVLHEANRQCKALFERARIY